MQFLAFMNEVASASRSQLSLTTHPITGEPGTSWYLSAPTGGIDTGNITVLFLHCYGPTLHTNCRGDDTTHLPRSPLTMSCSGHRFRSLTSAHLQL